MNTLPSSPELPACIGCTDASRIYTPCLCFTRTNPKTRSPACVRRSFRPAGLAFPSVFVVNPVSGIGRRGEPLGGRTRLGLRVRQRGGKFFRGRPARQTPMVRLTALVPALEDFAP